MPKVFICYRRDDAKHPVGRIYDHLVRHYGHNQLFKDVNSISPGQDFPSILRSNVEACEVLLAVIGDQWIDSRKADGMRRLDDPLDYVRLEIEVALERDIPVIPVLVGSQDVPSESQLPPSLRKLAYRHGVPVRPDPDFSSDVERLVLGIRDTLQAKLRSIRTNNDPADQALSAVGPNHTLPARRNQAIKVGILKSGNASYVHDIERAFTKRLERDMSFLGIEVHRADASVEWGPEDRIHWCPIVNRLLARGGSSGFDYLVTIGTQATVALRQTLRKQFGETPTLFLGVTYPKLTGIVDSEHYRFESKQVTGIRYGCGLDTIASLIRHRLFPDRQLVFVHQEGIPQDEMAELDLIRTRFALEGTLRFLKLDRRIQASDLDDPDSVYFSWYTFTRLFHESEASILADRLAISIMEDNVRDGLAVAGTGTDHNWIGEQGAEILKAHVQAAPEHKPDWGCKDVLLSPVLYWLNLAIAKRFGVEFSAKTLRNAAALYD